MRDAVDWLDEYMATLKPLYAKRLSYYDIAVGDDPPGIFIPRQVMFRVTPKWHWAGRTNPTLPIELTIDSHPYTQTVEIVWYNSTYRGGDRNETRLRGFDDASVLADPESTGALVVFAFRPETRTEPPTCHVWMCRTAAEADRVEERIGPVDAVSDALWPHMFQQLDKPRDWLGTEGYLEPLVSAHFLGFRPNAPASNS